MLLLWFCDRAYRFGYRWDSACLQGCMVCLVLVCVGVVVCQQRMASFPPDRTNGCTRLGLGVSDPRDLAILWSVRSAVM